MTIRLRIAVGVVLGLNSLSAFAQPPGFILSLDSLPSTYAATYVGNGNIGVSSSILGTTPARSYRAWLFDHPADDVARICALPAWNSID